MNQRTLYRAAYLLALCIGGAIASAGVRDLRWHPSIPDPPIFEPLQAAFPPRLRSDKGLRSSKPH